ncbi:hypothetical protein OS493_006539 [Desmophyllum pertusum]|uniref:EGF-like domain-containing protein n=1 Tax=Desmophyllum pertusum TaxID=174260 RepID=A0A9X0DD13_9CNID|nr:hypothetical protein OS493_006539 [Desmophyllum pertusum]
MQFFTKILEIFHSQKSVKLLPAPAKCESDRDCLRGKARCIRRECHCKSSTAFGDGKRKCEEWTQCRNVLGYDPCRLGGKAFANTHCIQNKDSGAITCKCNNGYFGRPKYPRCMRNSGADSSGRLPCLKKANCPVSSNCYKNKCTCSYELRGNGETCKRPPPLPCLNHQLCKEGKCVGLFCRCMGKYQAGNGRYCRKAKPCPRNTNKCGANARCLIDPLLPKSNFCKCNPGFYKSKDGECLECLSTYNCKKTYSFCFKGTCVCLAELVLGKESCEPGEDIRKIRH